MNHGRLTHLLLAAMQNLFCWAMSMQQTLQSPQMTALFTSFGTHQCQHGIMLPYAVIETKTGKAVGMTTFMNIDAPHRRLEIGSTWFRKSVQRSAINTECKMMLLTYAFEELDCIAVEFRTHILNH